MPSFKRLAGTTVAGFGTDRHGNVATIFALAIMPILFAAGAAIDYSAASDLRVRLQKATDGTNLILCQAPNLPTAAQLKTTASRTLTGYMGRQDYTIQELRVDQNPRKITLTTGARYDTAITKILGSEFSTVDVAATAQCENPQQQTFEIALVLDNTGSMAASGGGGSKMDALKSSATNFVKFVYATPKLAQAKISIVPFAAAVAVSPTTFRTASWIDQSAKSPTHWSFLKDKSEVASLFTPKLIKNRLDLMAKLKTTNTAWDWTGCLESLTYPYNVQDGKPSSSAPGSYYVPMFSADESGNGGETSHTDASKNVVSSSNSYIDDDTSATGCAASTDETIRTGRACKYLQPKGAVSASTGPNNSCTTRPLTRLTSDTVVLNSEIDAMQPNGNTNIHEGMMWGWRTLSPNSVLADGAAYNKLNNNKIVILMTDGANTWSSNGSNVLKSRYSAYGYYNNPDGTTPNSRMPAANANVSTDTQARAAIDALTLESCQNMAASPSNVVIYTIGFSVPSDPIDAKGISMLRTCAGSADRAFIANDSSGLQAAFDKIANDIGALRLTN